VLLDVLLRKPAFGPAPDMFDPIEANVERNGINPGSEFTTSVKLRQVFPDSDKCVLHNFTIVFIPKHKPRNDAGHIPAMPFDKQPESAVDAIAGQRHQFVITGGPVEVVRAFQFQSG